MVKKYRVRESRKRKSTWRDYVKFPQQSVAADHKQPHSSDKTRQRNVQDNRLQDDLQLNNSDFEHPPFANDNNDLADFFDHSQTNNEHEDSDVHVDNSMENFINHPQLGNFIEQDDYTENVHDGVHHIDVEIENVIEIQDAGHSSSQGLLQHCQSSTEEFSVHDVENELQKMMKQVNKTSLIGTLSLYGKPRFTLKQYEFLCFLLSALGCEDKLPSHSFLRSKFLDLMISSLLVKSKRMTFQCTPVSKGSKDAVVVLPSSWAKIDVATLSTFLDMFPDAPVLKEKGFFNQRTIACHRKLSIRETAVVQERESIFNKSRTMGVKYRGLEKNAKRGDIFTFQYLTAMKPLPSLSSSGWKCLRSPSNRNAVVEGQFEFSWTPGTQSNSELEWCSIPTESQSPLHKKVISFLKKCSRRRDTGQIATMDESDDSEEEIPNQLETVVTDSSRSVTPSNTGGIKRYRSAENHQRETRNSQVPSDRSATHHRNFMSLGQQILRNKTKASTPSSEFRRRHNQQSSDVPCIYSGDTCSLVHSTRMRDEKGPHLMVVIVNRFWRGPSSDSSDLCLWISEQDDGSLRLVEQVKVVGECQVIFTTDENISYTSNAARFQDHGKIEETGETFYTYRVLLYADDFNPRSALFPQGSVGGFYMIPLNLSDEKRRGLSATRTISLTPTHVSTNQVFDTIIQDLLIGSTEGFASTDPFNNPIRIFIDVVGFVADYPASSNVLDVMSHSAGAPCTVCTYRRRPKDTDGSRYGHTTTANFTNSSFCRGIHRTRVLRSETFEKKFANYLGFNDGTLDDLNEAGKWPLLKLGIKMLQMKPKFTQSPGKFVHDPLFEPYAQNVVAPDHCLTGLTKGLITSAFEQLPDVQKRVEMDQHICTSLQAFGLSSHSSIYNAASNTMHSISMSYTYAVLSILPFALSSVEAGNPPVMDAVQTMRKLVALTFWWPSVETDGEEAFQYVHGRNRHLYYRDMRKLAVKYVEHVDQFCKSYPDMKKNVDKPNVHRMLELYMHTIVLFGHANFISEMLLEAAHQPLKYSLSRNNSKNAHISAVYHVLLRDWFTRLLEVQRLYEDINDESQRDQIETCVQLNLRSLMYGDLVKQLLPDNELHDVMDEQVSDALKGPVTVLLETWYGESSKRRIISAGDWEGQCPLSRREISLRSGTLFHSSLMFSRKNLKMVTITEPGSSISVYSKAIFKRNHKSKYYKQHVLRSGDAVEFFSLSNEQHDQFIIPNNFGKGTHFLFLVISIVGYTAKKAWFVGCRMKESTVDDKYVIPPFTKQNMVLVKLSSSVRKAHIHGSLNQCDDLQCHGNEEVFVLRRKSGYPPRQA